MQTTSTAMLVSSQQNVITQITNLVDKVVPDPNNYNIHNQIALHLEKFSTVLSSLKDAGSTQRARDELGLAIDVTSHAQKQVAAYTSGSEIVLSDLNRVELLDALCRQIITAVGLAHMLNMDISSALQEVANSDDTVLDDDGNPIFNEQKKVVKSRNYTYPNLYAYT